MQRLLGILGALTLLLWLMPGAAMASCLALPLQDHIAGAPVIVSGKVAKVEQPAKGGTHVTFTVDRVYKGSSANPILIYSESGPGMETSIDYNMARGEAHTLYLSPGEDGTFYTTNQCTGSHPGQPTADEVKLLGSGQPAPDPSAPQPPAPAESAPVRLLIPIIAVAVAAAAIAGVVLISRLRRKG